MQSDVNKMSQQRYQGYPYVSPVGIDAPSLSAEEAAALARWQNLPKKLLQPLPPHHFSKTDLDRPVVYIDLPDSNSSGISSQSATSCHSASHSQSTASNGRPSLAKDLELDRPVVYIDIPENDGRSEVSQTIEEEEPEFVQETIFYDPFKDQRIVPGSPSEETSGGSPTAGSSRPVPPSSLSINTPGSSGYNSFTSPIPPMLSKEAYVYGRQPTPDDGFSLTPIPVNEFPAYPPPYEEIDRDRDRVQATPEQTVVEQPRTQVITSPTTPSSPIQADGQRKLLTCQHCNATIQTLVIHENGLWTHILAVLCFIFIMPAVILVYLMDCCKYKNHYCPNCNKKIGHQSPLNCDSDHIDYD